MQRQGTPPLFRRGPPAEVRLVVLVVLAVALIIMDSQLRVLEPVRTLTATIAAELGEAPVHSDHYQVLFIIGILLFTITFIINLAADLIVRGVRRK